MSRRSALGKTERHVKDALFQHIRSEENLAVIQAPPGSGKTWLLLDAAEVAVAAGQRVAVTAQTRAQADDICLRLLDRMPAYPVMRFLSQHGDDPPGLPERILCRTSKQLPAGPCVVVGTGAKWGLTDLHVSFDLMLVDEAWQMCWADFMLLGRCAGRFVLIGDPGQIPPTVPIEAARWATAPLPPHRAAPEVILADPGIQSLALSLPATRRLPHDSVDLVRRFYDFPFSSWAEPGDRVFESQKSAGGDPIDRLIDQLVESSVVGLTLPTPVGGPPMEYDAEMAAVVAAIATRLLARKSRILRRDREERTLRELQPADIGISSTHRLMNSCLETALPKRLLQVTRVDTPERWQGLERDIMIVVHPLSGVVHPSAFALETGRLCVMASRHKVGLMIVTRDHVGETLGRFLPAADQPLGGADVNGRGHDGHVAFWEQLEKKGRIVGT
jgi:hypothetical protein